MNCSAISIKLRQFCFVCGCFVLACLASGATAQEKQPTYEWNRIETKTDASFRGLAVVDDQTFWVSGSNGTVLRSTDGGKTIENVSVPNADDRDFRDIHAFDNRTAIVMNAGSPGVLYRTTDAGKNWTRVYNDTRKEIFFDAMDFWDAQRGVAFGDPIDGRMVIIVTADGGKTWKEIDRNLQPELKKGEAGFAASGSCLVADGKQSILIATGSHVEGESNETSRILLSRDLGKQWSSMDVPIMRNQSSGIFSLAIVNREKTMIAVGGDYLKPGATSDNCAISLDAGRTWQAVKKNPPNGFRSAVATAKLGNTVLVIAAGTNGIDLSLDLGKTWKPVSKISTNAIAFAPGGQRVYSVGPKGSVAIGSLKKQR